MGYNSYNYDNCQNCICKFCKNLIDCNEEDQRCKKCKNRKFGQIVNDVSLCEGYGRKTIEKKLENKKPEKIIRNKDKNKGKRHKGGER